jgi:hypothetical protein
LTAALPLAAASSGDPTDHAHRIQLQRIAKSQELDHRDSVLPILAVPDKALNPPHSLSELFLRQAGKQPLFLQQPS